MLRFLQKRKFRLVTRWKLALKDNMGFQVPAHAPFPFTLIFRAFDEVIRLLKLDASGTSFDAPESFLANVSDDATPTADQYMELFLSGRDVLGEFLESDPSFCSLFEETPRRELRASLEQVFKHLIDREMREYARRHSSIMPR